jgi:hypothetical protein
MTAARDKCPTSGLWGDGHFVAGRRWTFIPPDGEEIMLCSAACPLAWIGDALPADPKESRQDAEAA